MFTELATTPKPYFQERIKYPALKQQVLVVLLVGIAVNVWRVAIVVPLGATASYIDDAMVLLTLAGLAEYVLLWLVIAGVIHLLASVAGGDSRYDELLRLTGYGFAPIIVGGAIRSAGYYLALSGGTPPDSPRGSGFEASLSTWNEFVAQTAGDAIVLGALVVGSVFVVLAGYLWLLAVTVVTDLETDRAGAVASVATLLVVVWWLRPVIF